MLTCSINYEHKRGSSSQRGGGTEGVGHPMVPLGCKCGASGGILFICDRRMVEKVEEWVGKFTIACAFKNVDDKFEPSQEFTALRDISE